MEIKTKKSEIVKALKRVEKAVVANSALPILTGIMFNAREGHLTLTATNLEMTIKTVANVDVIREGGIVLPAKYIVELFKRMPDTDICINAKTPESATIIYGNAETNFNGYLFSDFPQFPVINGENPMRHAKIQQDQFSAVRCLRLKTTYSRWWPPTRLGWLNKN